MIDPVVGLEEAEDDVEERALARSGWADDPDGLARADREADVLQRGLGAGRVAESDRRPVACASRSGTAGTGLSVSRERCREVAESPHLLLDQIDGRAVVLDRS